MRRYETVFILQPDQGEGQIKQTVRRFEEIVAAGGGELIETEPWGIRELAYKIKRERRGYYVRLDYAASAAVVNELERNLKLADDVLRYLSVLVDLEADPARLRAEIETRNRRAAEAKITSAPAEQAAQQAGDTSAGSSGQSATPTESDGGADQS